MSPVLKLLSTVRRYKIYTSLGVLFHILTAILTVISIPLIIPFFQILFGISPSDYAPPDDYWDLEHMLNYGFSRLIAMTDHFVALTIVCIMVLVVFFLKNLCRFLISFYMIYVRNGMLREVRSSVWRGYESLSLAQRHNHRQGYLMSLITNDLSEVDHGILKAFELLFKTPLVILGSLLFMIWLNAQLTLIAFLLILFTLLVIGGLSHVLKRQSAEAQDRLSTISILVDQYLSAMRLIRTHHATGYFRDRFERENEEYFKISNKILRRRDLASPLAEFLGVVTIVLLLYFGTHAVLADEMEPATFFAFIFAFYNIIDPAKSFSREYANVMKGAAALERIDSFIQDSSVTSDDSLGEVTASFDESLGLRDVTFSYGKDGHQPVLDACSITITKGDRVGIVGISGAGKTTVLDLLLGFYRPDQGSARLDGDDIKTKELSSYRSLFGLVTQTPMLFHGTVRDNIVLDQCSDEARLMDVIGAVGLPTEFLDKDIGDQTTKLSGGESQRVCLARVLYRSPEIFLLDEATSQLDGPAQIALLETIHKISKGKTVVMVTHQIAQLKDMDRIIVIKDGRIIEEDTYEVLYERSDTFRSLVR